MERTEACLRAPATAQFYPGLRGKVDDINAGFNIIY
jgi:hypothetical protein